MGAGSSRDGEEAGCDCWSRRRPKPPTPRVDATVATDPLGAHQPMPLEKSPVRASFIHREEKIRAMESAIMQERSNNEHLMLQLRALQAANRQLQSDFLRAQHREWQRKRAQRRRRHRTTGQTAATPRGRTPRGDAYPQANSATVSGTESCDSQRRPLSDDEISSDSMRDFEEEDKRLQEEEQRIMEQFEVIKRSQIMTPRESTTPTTPANNAAPAVGGARPFITIPPLQLNRLNGHPSASSVTSASSTDAFSPTAPAEADAAKDELIRELRQQNLELSRQLELLTPRNSARGGPKAAKIISTDPVCESSEA